MTRRRWSRRAGAVLPLLLFIVLIPRAGASDEGDAWFELAGGPPGAEPRVQAHPTDEGTLIDVVVPGFVSRTVETVSGPRMVLAIPGGGVTGELGAPRLPVLRYLLATPPGASVKVELTPAETRVLPLYETGNANPLIPVQLPVPKIEGAEASVPYVEDEDAFASDAFLPDSAARIVGSAVLRGRHVSLVEVSPVRYNPAAGTLEVWSSAAVRFSFEGGDRDAARREKGRLDSPALDAWLDEAVLGPSSPGSDPPTSTFAEAGGTSEGAEGMLVIAHDDFVDAVQPFIDWKRKTGYKIELVRTSDLGSGPTDADVKAAIQERYDTWSGPSLGFVLLVGDTDFCPIHLGNGGGKSQVTDNWYACVDGTDILPDLAIARISTRTATETSDVVDKLLTYEKATFATTAWTKTAGFIGTADSSHWGLVEGTHDWCIDTYYTPNDYLQTTWSHGGNSSDRHFRTYDADTSEIAASIDEGRSIVNYSGHGSNYSWAGPTSHGSYDQTDVNSNTNDGMYPFVISNACITGTLNNTECFGETWQKAPNKGAIAFWGASNNSYWNEDDYLQRSLHGNIFPMDDTPPIGVIVNETKIDLYDYYGDTSTVRYYFDMYNLLSEPSLSLWTRAPRAWDVSYPDTHPLGEPNFTVSVSFGGQPVEGALVAVRKDDEGVFESGYTDANGEVTLVLDPIPQAEGTMDVTATKHDFLPHEGTTEVAPANSPRLVYRQHALNDVDACDPDGNADVGETVWFLVTIRNDGAGTATGITASLSSSAEVEVLNNPAVLPDLPVDTETIAAFQVLVGAVSCLEQAQFTLDMAAAEGSWGDSFYETLERDLQDATDLENLEHGGVEPAGWSHLADQGTDDWQMAGDRNHTDAGGWSWFSSNSRKLKDDSLVSASYAIAGASSLEFWHWVDLQDSGDGGVLEISDDDGASWTDLGPAITEGGYDATLTGSNPISGRGAWSGSYSAWKRTVADLTPWDGRSIRLRWRLTCDKNRSRTGWWIDDVTVNSHTESCDGHPCGVPGEVEIASVSKETSEAVFQWGDDPLCVEFRVWRSTDPASADAFTDVTSEDADPTDTTFRDASDGDVLYFIIQGRGPDGDGPWGHFGQ